MALPFLTTLSLSARTAYPFVLSGVRQGLSSRSIEKMIRGAGLPISRTRSILPMMRHLNRLEAAGRNIRNIPKANTINVGKLPEALTRLRREFSYQVRIRGVDAFGNPIDRFLTVATDNPRLSPGDIEAAAESMVGSQGQSETVFEVAATLQSGVRQASGVPL